MYSNNRSSQTPVPESSESICPKCGFENHQAAIYCEICFYPLNKISKKSQSLSLNIGEGNLPFPQLRPKIGHKLKHPKVIGSLIALGIVIALSLNYLVARQTGFFPGNSTSKIPLRESIAQAKNVPAGLFSYGGEQYFATLLTNSINPTVRSIHPEFNLRFTKPTNSKSGVSSSIQMLLDGELSFTLNDRPLTEREYTQANLRNLNLKQVPVAIDGVALFGNPEIAVKQLNLNQIRQIFTGEISNWQELGDSDQEIVPIMLTPENLRILGLDSLKTETAQYAGNYTLALRQIIGTPGAISFASASLLQSQRAVTIFSLAEEDTKNFHSPFINQQPNLKLFTDGTYPLTRRLFLVFRQDGTPDEQAGRAYSQMLLSDQGQEIIKQAGFVPLYGKK